MKIKGKVIKYNDASGIIRDNDNNTYIFTKNNIKNDIELKEDDKVMFLAEKFKTIDVDENIATFIENI